MATTAPPIPFVVPALLTALRDSAVRLRPLSALLVALPLALPVLSPRAADAQRRPGVGMGFYTTTGLLTADLDLGQVSSSTALAEAPAIALSALVTAPLKKARKSAWLVGARGTALSFGNWRGCAMEPGSAECIQRRFVEAGAVLTGGAFDIRETILRTMVGPAIYMVEGRGPRVGTQLRLDVGSPRQGSRFPTLFLTGTFLGSERGRRVTMSSLGASLRLLRKR